MYAAIRHRLQSCEVPQVRSKPSEKRSKILSLFIKFAHYSQASFHAWATFANATQEDYAFSTYPGVF